MQLRIKASKTNKSNKSEYVEIFESRNVTCPVKAIKKFLSATKHIDESAPVFCNDDFHPMTVGWLNKKLKSVMGHHFKDFGGVISPHSFRAGLVSLMAKEGHNEEVLKSLGRWSSRAYLAYVKLGRSYRYEIAKFYRDLN